MLERLAELTGMSSTYLAETRLTSDEQYIVFSCNRSDLFHIPEDVTLPWSEGVCRFVVEGGPNYTNDAQKQFPKSSVARLLEIRTFVSYPVFTAEGWAAQARHHEISGIGRTHFCGAYWRWGFHEDGVVSALRVVERLS